MGAKRSPREVVLAMHVTDLSPSGEAVCIVEHDDARRAVFVRGGAPGEHLRASVDFGERPARGRLLELLEPSPDRVLPACPVVDRCGGCDWMHLTPDAQSRAHRAHLAAALPASWREHPVSLVRPEPALGYRTRARLHLRATGGRAVVGIHEARTRTPIEAETCAVLDPSLERARLAVGALFDGAHGRGDLSLALGALAPLPASGARPAVLAVRFDGTLPAPVFGRIERAVADGWLGGAHLRLGEANRPTVIGDPTPWIAGGDGAPLRLAPGGFAQASDAGTLALTARVDALAAQALEGVDARAARVVELYAGAGNFTVMLARRAGHVTAVESHAEACRAAEANLRARGLEGRVVEGDAGAFELPRGTRLVVLDPPRTGARAVAERLALSRVPHVVYVSCDLATLGRDLATLAPAYALRAIELCDLFPQTSHVETIVWLERRAAGTRARDGAP